MRYSTFQALRRIREWPSLLPRLIVTRFRLILGSQLIPACAAQRPLPSYTTPKSEMWLRTILLTPSPFISSPKQLSANPPSQNTQTHHTRFLARIGTRARIRSSSS